LKSPQPPNDYDGVFFTTNTLKMVRWGDSLRFVALEKFALGIYMPVEDHFNLLEEENVLRPTCILG
jgi:hypothetical protein